MNLRKLLIVNSYLVLLFISCEEDSSNDKNAILFTTNKTSYTYYEPVIIHLKNNSMDSLFFESCNNLYLKLNFYQIINGSWQLSGGTDCINPTINYTVLLNNSFRQDTIVYPFIGGQHKISILYGYKYATLNKTLFTNEFTISSQ